MDLDLALKRCLDPGLLQGAVEIVRTLQQHGHEALFAGGVVRDLLLGRRAADIDIATSASPEQIERLFEKTVPVGKQFGVMMVSLSSHHYEVATFREDAAYLDGRHPSQVRFSDSSGDALRRDFTVNALFLDPMRNKILDFVGGQADLEAQLLKTVGRAEERFGEDKLRIIRAIRLACELDFRLEEETWRQVIHFAPQVLLVSWERIRDEVLRILTSPQPARGLQLMLDSGILEAVLPEVSAMVGVEQPPEFHPEGDVFVHTSLMFSLAGPLDEVLALGVLLHDVGKPPTFKVEDRIRFHGHADVGADMAEKICRRLRLSTDLSERVVALVRNHLRFIPVKQMRDSTLKRFLRLPDFEKHLELHRLDCLASHGDLSSYDFCRQKLRELTKEEMRPRPLLGGKDLIDLGLEPGPQFSEILRQLEDLQLEGELDTREDALAWVREHYSG